MKRLVPGILLAAALAPVAGCMTLHDIDQQTPKYIGEARGDYFTVAECLHARQVQQGNTETTLARDKQAGRATVVVNGDAGPLAVYVTTDVSAGVVAVKYYTNLSARPEVIGKQILACSAT